MRHPLLLLSCFAALGLAATDAGADLFKCVGKDGRTSFQADPCPAAADEKRIRTGAERGETGPNGVEMIDVAQAVKRISGQRGRTSVVLLYATTCPLSQQMFAEFVSIANRYRSRGVDFLVFSTDDEDEIGAVPAFLSACNASFPPVAIKPWPEGTFGRAMTPLGIEIRGTWTRPLIAVLDAKGKVVIQGQGVTDLSRLPLALDALVR